MKSETRQANYGVRSWDDAIRIAKDKISGLKGAVKGFEMAKARGESCHEV